jgi:hypothetical protein
MEDDNMNKYQDLLSMLLNLEMQLEDKNCRDKETEIMFQLVRKEIDRLRETDHETKNRITDLLRGL